MSLHAMLSRSAHVSLKQGKLCVSGEPSRSLPMEDIDTLTCNGSEAADKHELRLKSNLPEHGSVRVLRITERQYTAMRILCGSPSPDLDVNHEKTPILTL